MQISEAQHNAAGEMVDLIVARLGDGGAVHSVTAIASASRLAGSLLLRSFGLNIKDLQPGVVVLSTEANERGPELVNILGSMLQHFGVPLDEAKLGGDQTEVDEEPELSVTGSLELLQDDAWAIAQKNGLDLREAAHAAALATAFIVKECANDLGSEKSFNLAIYGFIEGSKTVPPTLSTNIEQFQRIEK
jgi:hypothetical protein